MGIESKTKRRLECASESRDCDLVPGIGCPDKWGSDVSQVAESKEKAMKPGKDEINACIE
jgi:hypothetical protein